MPFSQLSSPHIILLLNVSKKDIFCNFIKKMGFSALRTVNSDPHGALNDLLSMLAAEERARPPVRSVTVEVSGITMGRMVRL